MRFTSLNAREMALRSVAARKAAQAERNANRAAALLQAAPVAGEDYAATRLVRVRVHLDLLDGRILAEVSRGDPKLIRDLAMASQYLSEQEFALAGRPKPGNRKPVPERKPHSQVTNTPQELSLLPVPPAVPTYPAPEPPAPAVPPAPVAPPPADNGRKVVWDRGKPGVAAQSPPEPHGNQV